MVVFQPSKLATRVRFPSPAPATKEKVAQIAQLVEHFIGNEEVVGSNPILGSQNIAYSVQRIAYRTPTSLYI